MMPSKGTIIILARHFPPAVSGGARRPFVLTEGLRARGWRVYVASPSAPENYADWIQTAHPAGVRGEAAAAAPDAPHPLDRVRSLIRHAVYWPDGDMRWALSAARAVRASGVRPNWVISTSPPESAHLAAYLAHRAVGGRWLAEFRDSWIDEPLREELRRSAVRRAIERRLARALIGRADRIVAASSAIADEVLQYRRRAPDVDVVGHFAAPTSKAWKFDGQGPHLLHVGRFTLSHPERNIVPVLDAFAAGAADLPNARLHLAGQLTPDEIVTVRAKDVAGQVILHGVVPHDTALAMQKAADGLILCQPPITALPGKVSEYLLSTAPILTVGDGSWLSRLAGVPHSPLANFPSALDAPKRCPSDSLSPALDAYESLMTAI